MKIKGVSSKLLIHLIIKHSDIRDDFYRVLQGGIAGRGNGRGIFQRRRNGSNGRSSSRRSSR